MEDLWAFCWSPVYPTPFVNLRVVGTPPISKVQPRILIYIYIYIDLTIGTRPWSRLHLGRRGAEKPCLGSTTSRLYASYLRGLGDGGGAFWLPCHAVPLPMVSSHQFDVQHFKTSVSNPRVIACLDLSMPLNSSKPFGFGSIFQGQTLEH